ncbi:response regulator transcription factor [Cellulosilyticum sp. I15G10I2]|uniref:response regulator transcription factor n=1 Tax=Cellulosilyticum sp. I15G10I2 TaxID=1892843 RepID=UPI00085CAD03|nr:response regulator [Cellulosilyticum sp. I15G10I2]
MYKVLIIDDEHFIRAGMQSIIPWHQYGCEIAGEAENGEEGIDKIIKLKPDIIFADIRMPKKNGLDMIAEVKSINKDMQIIILTGHREFEYAQEAVKLGVLRFLLKPSKMSEIKETVEQAVSNLDLIASCPSRRVTPMKEGQTEKEKPQFIVNKALDYINRYYNTKLDLQTVADALYVSTWHLCKLLKKQTGDNFIDIVNRVRIEKAKTLLLQSTLRVYEIAEEVGYVDAAYFSKTFKKFVRVTPNEYRNKMY